MFKIEIMNSHLYILQCQHFFKIGTSTNMAAYRMKSMTTGNPFAITVVLDVTFSERAKGPHKEQILHRKFKKKRVKGEWFALKPIDVEYIKTYCANDASFYRIIENDIRKPFKEEDKSNNYWDNKYLNELARFAQKDAKWEYMMKDYEYWKNANHEWKLSLNEREGRLDDWEKALKKREKSLHRVVRDFSIKDRINEYIDTLPKRIDKLVSKLSELKAQKTII